MNTDEITFTENLTTTAGALLTAPFVLFLVAIIVGALFVMAVKRQ